MSSMTAAVNNFITDTGLDPARVPTVPVLLDLLRIHHDPDHIDPHDFALIVWTHETSDTAAPPAQGALPEGE